MLVRVEWRDLKVYTAVVEVASAGDVTEELVNTLDVKFVERPVEIDGWLEITDKDINQVRCSECNNIFDQSEMADTGRCQTCEDWIVTD